MQDILYIQFSLDGGQEKIKPCCTKQKLCSDRFSGLLRQARVLDKTNGRKEQRRHRCQHSNNTYDDDLEIPQIENGYYYFYDRHDEATDPYDDSEFLARFSFNFTLAIYDSDTNTLYLCEYDT